MGIVFGVYEGRFREQDCSRNAVERVDQPLGVFPSGFGKWSPSCENYLLLR